VRSTGQQFSASLPSIGPGRSFTVTIEVSGPNGNQDVDLFVDSFNSVFESNEQDNAAAIVVNFVVIG